MMRGLVATLVVACVAFAASFAAAARGATPPLCAHAGAVTGVRVQRVHPAGRIYGVPARVAVGRARARLVAQLVCGLPPFPQGIFGCPIDFGTRYVVAFSGVRAVVTIDPTGCQGVSGLGTRRTVMRAPSFWSKLGRDLGLGAKTAASFRGR